MATPCRTSCDRIFGDSPAFTDFTRQKVIDALNCETEYEAGGMNAPIDWTRQHTDLHYPRSCIAFLTVENGKFAQLWGAPGKPFTCWDGNPATVETSKPYARQ